MIIAVDGPTASGKGTIAKALAAHFGLPHLDTGLLYRAVGRQVFLDGGDPDDAGDALAATGFPDTLLGDPELRDEQTGGLASRVSVHPAVRQALFDRQRSFATRDTGAVLDGRDIGTVIAPEAQAKLFVTASVEARAQRRFLEMRERGVHVPKLEIADDLRRRLSLLKIENVELQKHAFSMTRHTCLSDAPSVVPLVSRASSAARWLVRSCATAASRRSATSRALPS